MIARSTSAERSIRALPSPPDSRSAAAGGTGMPSRPPQGGEARSEARIASLVAWTDS
jgi:hypothetical protein